MTDRVLVIEDDTELASQVLSHLKQADLEPVWWSVGKPIRPADLTDVRLVILDLMLPGVYGLDILKQMRTHSDVPVLVLSARNDSVDKVRALKLGADDYLTKPFWPQELVERVRARLRRPALNREGPVVSGNLRVDPAAREVRVSGELVELTKVEFDLLLALVRREGAAITRQWLTENVLDPEREGSERTLDVHVSRLRKKLGPEQRIETVWGIGYRLKPGDAI